MSLASKDWEWIHCQFIPLLFAFALFAFSVLAFLWIIWDCFPVFVVFPFHISPLLIYLSLCSLFVNPLFVSCLYVLFIFSVFVSLSNFYHLLHYVDFVSRWELPLQGLFHEFHVILRVCMCLYIVSVWLLEKWERKKKENFKLWK